jgi:hypothetical protein
MTRLEAAEMCFLRSVKGYTRLEKIRSEVIRSITRHTNKNKTGSTISDEWTSPDFRNTPSTTTLEGEEIVDAPGKDGNASMSEQVKRPNPWRKIMMMMVMVMVMVMVMTLLGFICPYVEKAGPSETSLNLYQTIQPQFQKSRILTLVPIFLEMPGRRARRCKQPLDNHKKTRQIERGSTISQFEKKWLWKGLWTRRRRRLHELSELISRDVIHILCLFTFLDISFMFHSNFLY